MKRLTLFCGHYGSGKTNIAVNYALHLKSLGLPVAIADLDIVNPYFRTKDSQEELEAAGVRVIALPFANSNVDLPSVPTEAYSVFNRPEEYAVFDIGGDDRGAYVLGRFAPYILQDDFENLFVVNFRRPLTTTAEEAYAVLREIEEAGKIPFTGIVNNSNLGEETTAEDVLSTAQEVEKLSRLCGLPLVFTTVSASLAPSFSTEVFPLKLQKKYW